MSRPKQDRLDYNSNSYNGNLKLDSIGTGTTDGDYKWRNLGINLNFQHQFKKPGKEITTDFNYINYDAQGNQRLPSTMKLPDGTLTSSNEMQYIIPSATNIYTVKTDYTHPFSKKARFEAGVKSSWVNTNNATNYFTVTGNIIVPDYNRTNQFIYRENINSAYINLRNE
jgi:hypothetical protein